MPTLEETIDVTKGKIKLNIELKIYGHQKHLEEVVVKLVEEKGIEDQCVITSLEYNALKEVRRPNQDLKIGMIITYLIGEYSKLDVDLGVDNIINDDPVRVRELLTEKQNRKSNHQIFYVCSNTRVFIWYRTYFFFGKAFVWRFYLICFPCLHVAMNGI